MSPDPWSWYRAGKELLDLLPEIVAFIAGGAWSLLLVRFTRKKAKKDWDADFMSRYKEEARSEIRERDVYIANIKAQLDEERTNRREIARRAKAAVVLTGRITEALGTVELTPAANPGFDSQIRRRAQ